MSRDRAPGRQTGPATSTTRRTWYGYGKLSRTEKSGFGRFLHDCSSIFGDISMPALPMLLVVLLNPDPSGFGPVGAAIVTWATLILVGTLIRGGWIKPFATDTLGWVSITPVLVLVRIVYFNSAIALAVFGSTSLAAALGIEPLVLVFAALISAVAALAFPRVGESVYRRVRD
ncbi:hypothetical protein G6M89_10380 [Natronolimnobius sp. AArcel1]|uniref:hypothetical protein n=1 Tax=Natronolimnobius sp. AArcel1 TaxID=1679093 RepID=UPI0013ED479F|nr:hypothetical protein [Natronolimnobius sp. AArcel1]NGM69409.1 hypothetical protein [Natronolimnobius sp. AArcel1]